MKQSYFEDSKKQRHGLRKFKTGLASVAIGTTIAFCYVPSALASEVDDSEESTSNSPTSLESEGSISSDVSTISTNNHSESLTSDTIEEQPSNEKIANTENEDQTLRSNDDSSPENSEEISPADDSIADHSYQVLIESEDQQVNRVEIDEVISEIEFDENDFIIEEPTKNVYSIDAGRRYFTVDEVKHVIDQLSTHGYTDLHFLLGNDGFRFFLDDMTVVTPNATYADEDVRAGLQAGNEEFNQRKRYYPQTEKDYFTQAEMDELLAYALDKNINVIPGINSPGHMDAIVTGMEQLGIEDARFKLNGRGSDTTLNLESEEAVAFTQALTKKYVDYFSNQPHIEIFNFGADEYANDLGNALVKGNGFDTLIAKDLYDDFIQYLNDMAAIVKDANLRPMVFNDGVYYDHNEDYGEIDTDILVSVWTAGWNNYNPAKPDYLIEKGFDLLNTNDNWYFVLGRPTKRHGWYSLEMAREGMENFSFDDVVGSGNQDLPSVGSMVAFWADDPSRYYSQDLVDEHIETFARHNREEFIADYSALDKALALIPKELDLYTQWSVENLEVAKNKVEYDLPANRQADVNEMTSAILNALSDLKPIVEKGPESGETVPSYDDQTKLGEDITDVLVTPADNESPSYDDLTHLSKDLTDVVVDEGPESGETTPSYADLTKLNEDITNVVVDEGPEPGETTPSYDDLTSLGDNLTDINPDSTETEATRYSVRYEVRDEAGNVVKVLQSEEWTDWSALEQASIVVADGLAEIYGPWNVEASAEGLVYIFTEVAEELEDFALVIHIDGEHAQTSEYAQIPYSQFRDILAALTESYLGRGYTYERADFKENNEVVLSFSSPVEDSSYDDLTKPGEDITDVVVDEGPEPGETTPSYDDLTKPGEDITDVVVDEGPKPGETTPSYDDLTKPGEDITDVVVDEGPKPGETTPSYDDLTKPGKDIIDVVVDEDTKPDEKAQDPKQPAATQDSKGTTIVAKADPKKDQDSAQLPQTGFVSGSALGIGALLAVAGSAITFRRRK